MSRPIRDWRTTDYSFVLELEPGRQAWEFLRRNPDYQADFERALEWWISCRESDERELEAHSLARLVAARTVKAQPVGDPSHRGFVIRRADAVRWGLLGFVNPREDQPEHLGFGIPGYRRAAVLFGSEAADQAEPEGKGDGTLWPDFGKLLAADRTVHATLEAGQVAALVDLRLPIGPQLKRIEGTLKSMQGELREEGSLETNRPVFRREKWPRYLQALDASLAGERYDDIAAEMFPKPGPDEDAVAKVKHTLEQARLLTAPMAYLLILV